MLLLDTHTLLWWLSDDPALSVVASAAIGAPGTRVYVSAASAWEMRIKQAQGKLTMPEDLEDQLTRHRFRPLPITIGHGLVAGGLPPHHRDPFDRMLIAQAQLEGLTIVTHDPKFHPYGVPLLWT